MSGILSRIAKYEIQNGRYRRGPFNVVNTALGAMVEMVPIERYAARISSYDPNVDDDAIHGMEFDWDFKSPYFKDVQTDSTMPIHGGHGFLNQVQHVRTKRAER